MHTQKLKHPHILDDYPVKPPQIIGQKIFVQSLNLRILEQGIHSEINAPPVNMHIIDRLKQFVFRQVLCIRPRPELRPPDIDRICPRTDRRLQTLCRTRRRKYLYFPAIHTFPSCLQMTPLPPMHISLKKAVNRQPTSYDYSLSPFQAGQSSSEIPYSLP